MAKAILNDVTNLQFINFNTSDPKNYLEHCKNSYILWKSEWEKTFQELKTNKTLYSDDFLHREIGGLFLGTKPIGFILYQFEDITKKTTTDLHYFSNYESRLIHWHQQKNDLVMIATYFTTDPDWRKKNTNYSVSELLISFMNLRLIFSDANRMIGYFRNNRKTNEIFYRHGGEFIAHQNAYNVSVDFAEIYKDRAQLSEWKDHATLASKMWSQFFLKQKGEKYEFTRSLKPQIDERIGIQFSESRLVQ